jgi:hypothetical protein
MSIMATLCLTWVWAASNDGGADYYEVYLNNNFYAETLTEEAKVCVSETGEHFVHVIGIDESGQSGQGSDVGAYFYSGPKALDLVCGDFDDNRIVGWSDFGRFSQIWGKCNEGGQEASCDDL